MPSTDAGLVDSRGTLAFGRARAACLGSTLAMSTLRAQVAVFDIALGRGTQAGALPLITLAIHLA